MSLPHVPELARLFWCRWQNGKMFFGNLVQVHILSMGTLAKGTGLWWGQMSCALAKNPSHATESAHNWS